METKQLSKVFFTLCLMLLSGIPASFAQGASEFPTGINPNPTDIKLEPSSLNLRIHEKARLKATVQPSGANKDVTWEVSKGSNVVSVDKTGLVNAKAVGTATIVVTSTVNTMVSKTCTVTVRNPEESNISTLNNLIYIEKQDLRPGTTATLSIQMKNSTAIRSFQFDMYLPEGFSVVKNSNGRIMAELNQQRLPEYDKHTLTVAEQADGGIRFLCGSVNDKTFKGNDGEIATLKVTIAEDVQDGNYPIIITDMKLTETDISKFYDTPYLMTNMNVSSTGINPNPTDIKLEPSSLNLRIHEKARLKATVQPSGSNQDVTWEVSKGSNVVSVDKTGRVNAKAVGTATIVVTSTVNTMVSKTCTVTVRNPEESDISSLNNLIYIEKQDLHPGTTATLSIQMKNTAAIRGFQFDMYLPEGFSVVKNSNGRIMAELNPERLPEYDEHTLTVAERKDGAIRFLCSSVNNETFKGNDGEIATLKVTIAEDVQDGNYPIIITDMTLTETDTHKFYETPYLMIPMNVYYILGDVNGDEKVDVLDYTGVANHIMGMQQQGFVKQAADVDGNGKIDVSDYIGIANFIMKDSFSGKSSLRKSRREAGIENNYLYVQDKELQKNAKKDVEVTLTISMKNEAPIRGFQFDMYLPEGISVVKNDKERIMAKLCQERRPEDDEHTLRVAEREGGAIRFLCGSQYDESFTGNDGGLLTLQVNISKDLEPGDYQVLLKDLKLTETDISRFYEADEVPFTIKVMDGDAIHDIRAAEEDGVIYDLSGKAVSNPDQQGVIIVNGKKIVNK